MRHFLPYTFAKFQSDASVRLDTVRVRGPIFSRNFSLTAAALLALLLPAAAQQPVLTSRADNSRDGANTNETLLTPQNVNPNSFGHLFSTPVDYVALAQPLYVPNVGIPGQGTHNVVYVATAADSVYAIDADNGVQLWYASLLYGGTTASGSYLPCSYGGFKQQGIIGTPVIDPSTNTIYLVAKTVLNNTVRHHLHALDITTGSERPGSPVQITATSTSLKGTVTNFNSFYEMNRPGLLLANGRVYIGFGSNGCNGGNTGWVLSYDPTTLTQLNVFNTSPDIGLVSIWQAGVGLTADGDGNIYIETAESIVNGYDVPNGGQTYCNSVVKLAPDLSLADYFTPWTVAYLNAHDYDLSSTGAVVLPDQSGPYPHELIAGGKQGYVYVLDRDNLGMFAANDAQIIQEFDLIPGDTKDVLMGSPAYWNNTVYFAPNASPILAFPLSAGLLGTPIASSGKLPGAHSPSVSANGNSNGVLWVISGPQLLAYDATSLKQLYRTGASGTRDVLPPVAHFATQTVVNGKVYVATQNSLEAYALFHVVNITGGNNQTGTVQTALAQPIQIHVANPYTGQPLPGATVSFTDGNKGGSFNPASPVVTDANGNASTIYTLPKKAGTYAVTFSGSGFSNTSATVTANPGPVVKIIAYAGAKQTGAAGSTLARAIVAQAQDVYKNGVAGVGVTFTANNNGVLNPVSATTDTNGMASTNLQLPTKAGNVTVSGNATGFKKITFLEYAVAGPATTISVVSGNNQSGPAGTQLPQGLTVLVTDQFGNPVSGVDVDFDDSGAGGSFSNPDPGLTGTNGQLTQIYTLPGSPGTVTIHGAATGVANPAVFSEAGH
jgi:hypothetical protein